MKHKKAIIAAVCIVVLSALALYLCIESIIISVAERQLKSMCKDSIVSIGHCRVRALSSIILRDIEIKLPPIYDIKVKDLKISYSISSLIKGDILKFYLGDSSFDFNMGGKEIAQIKGYFNLGSGKGALKVNEVEISDLALMLETRDINFSGKISLALDPEENSIKNIDLKLDSLDAQGLLLENGYLSGRPSGEGAKFYALNIRYNDVKMSEVSGSVFVKENTVFLKSFKAKIFDGAISGGMSYRIDKVRDFTIDLKVDGLDLSTFVREMKMENKFQMTGELGGNALLNGNGLTLLRIEGDFSTAPGGGVLTIKDTRFLENMAKDSGQSLDILMESFKQYQYNIGLMKLSVDGSNLLLDIALDGASGKRNFNVVLHDFLSKKGWGI
jgi:hypothetical protein